jgi:hypothetical protein
MFCAGSLFPLMAWAADLCYAVRITTCNVRDIFEEAITLRLELDRWTPNERFVTTVRVSEASTQSIVHTAEAYRSATILYLQQALPETPGPSIVHVAQAIFGHLSRVPPDSSICFVQIYPLFVSGCEASTNQEREWVKERWAVMAARMRVTNVSKCWEITQEVWRRRDAYQQLRSENAQGVADNIGGLDPEFSIKGRLHWAAVMKDWDCEVSF